MTACCGLSGPCQGGPEPVAMARFRDLSHVCRMHAASAGPASRMPAKNAPVAQLDRALDYESRGQEFESLRARHLINDLATTGACCYRDVTGCVTESRWPKFRPKKSAKTKKPTSMLGTPQMS